MDGRPPIWQQVTGAVAGAALAVGLYAAYSIGSTRYQALLTPLQVTTTPSTDGSGVPAHTLSIGSPAPLSPGIYGPELSSMFQPSTTFRPSVAPVLPPSSAPVTATPGPVSSSEPERTPVAEELAEEIPTEEIHLAAPVMEELPPNVHGGAGELPSSGVSSTILVLLAGGGAAAIRRLRKQTK